MVGGALTVGFGIADFNSFKQAGDSNQAAFLKAAGSNILWSIPGMGKIALAMGVAEVLPAVAPMIGQAGKLQAGRQGRAYEANFGGNFQDSQAGYTMRQRGMSAIQQSAGNIRSVLGSEARSYYRYSHGQ